MTADSEEGANDIRIPTTLSECAKGESSWTSLEVKVVEEDNPPSY